MRDLQGVDDRDVGERGARADGRIEAGDLDERVRLGRAQVDDEVGGVEEAAADRGSGSPTTIGRPRSPR